MLGAVTLCAALLLAPVVALAAARTGADDGAEIERTVYNHPHQAIAEAQIELSQAKVAADRGRQLHALRILVQARGVLEESDGLREDALQGVQLARQDNDMVSMCEFMSALANSERLQNRYREALALYDEAIALAERHHLDSSLAKLYIDKAVLYDRLGRSSDALALLVQAYATFEARGDRFWMSNALQGIAGVSNEEKASADDRAKSIEYYKRALALLDPKVYRSAASDLYHNIGLAYYHLKDYPQARQYFETGQALAREIQDRNGVAYFDFRLGNLAKDEQQFDQALEFIGRAIPVFEAGEALSMLFQAHITRADVLSRMGRRKESLDALAAAQKLLAPLDTPARDATYYERSAEIYARFDDYESAFRQMTLLRDAEHRRVEAANLHLATELQTRFDVQQKEAENALLRAQQKESDARRWALFLALVLSLVLVGGLAFYLMHQMRQKRRIVSVAMRDELTGLPNRRSILEFARLQFGARRALDTGFCIAVVDLDHFKSVNDRFGHDVGDKVLVAFARNCQSALRSHDRLGRFGGEEFLLVMPGADLAQVPGIFERLREATLGLGVTELPTDWRLTFSMGGAEAGGDADTLDALIKRADEALYRAKQAGRDRCEIDPTENAGPVRTPTARAAGHESEPLELAHGAKKRAAS